MTRKADTRRANPSKSDAEFERDSLKDKIGNNLKQIYDEVVNEDVPEDFLALLAQAENKDH